MDAIFKALNDETRRRLLDALRSRDGQTLSELESINSMTRFGVMKHLSVLEVANLVVTRKAGRFKYHYLNAAPLQEVVDRWIEPLTAKAGARALLDLKTDLERQSNMSTDEKPDFVLETFIRAKPDKVWEALTSTELSKRYYIAGAAIQGDFKAGGAYAYKTADGQAMLSGKIIAADPPKRLEMTFVPGWAGPNAKASRNVYELTAVGDLTKLTILHFNIPKGQEGVKEGWAKIAASLKSLLETGKPLKFPMGAKS
jgi:uncharacterized protein YndB with AHSA1/START domain/DNA-binding transcriptional ArsR family regulator